MAKTKEITKEKAIEVLGLMLYQHENNNAFIDFDSEDEEEIEQANWWRETKQAYELAIKTLKETK